MFTVLELQMIETGLITRRTQMMDLSRNSVSFDDQQRKSWAEKADAFGALAVKVREMKAQLMHAEEAELEKQRAQEVEADQLQAIYQATDWV